ncbi:MAG: winged helix-turn-helix transcriptional regulator [Pseudobacteriovorax sp.]|nr:winged helix-turn-helix transcriptional regulator [Pseudobacteriovorax sp.]
MEIYGALKDPKRREILETLMTGTQDVSSIMTSVQLSQSATSQHLKKLQSAGLVEKERSGKHIMYTVRFEPLDEVVTWIQSLRKFWEQRLDRLDDYLGEKN